MIPAITIRKAVQEDQKAASELIYESMGRFGDCALGFDDHEFTLKVLSGFFQLKRNRFSHEITWIAEVDGQPAGVLTAFPGWEYWRRQLVMGRQAFRVYGVKKAIRLIFRSFALAGGKETERDEFYISHLAVHPGHRRLGVGMALLEQAALLMKKAGLTRCSLIVELDNLNAQALYKKAGFQVIRKVETPNFTRKFHTSGFFCMVKQF